MNHRPHAAGSQANPSPTTAQGTTPQWPVLARLSWIDASVADRDRSVVRRDPPTAQEYELRDFNEATPAAAHTRIDQSHATAHSYDWPAAAPSTPRIPAPQSSTRRLRVDAGSAAAHQPMTPASRRYAHSEYAEGAFAAHVYKWHAALAPYSGMAMAAALLLSATLLWSAVGQRSAQTASTPAPAPLWPAESTAPISLTHVPQPLSAPLEDLSPFSWSAKPAPQAVPATLEPTPQSINVPGSVATSSPAAAEISIPPAVAQPLRTPEQTVTPTPDAPGYPSTPFAGFDFESLRRTLEPSPADALAPPSIVAESAAQTASPPSTSR